MFRNYYTSAILIVLICQCFATFAQNNKHRLLVAEPIYFESGKSAVQSKFHPVLQQVAKISKENQNSKIWIHAHTDSVGSEAYNEILSQQRAQQVEIWLTSAGADTSRMDIRSYGEHSPLADDGNEEGRAENRRVMVYVVEPFDENSWLIDAKIRGKVVDARTQKPLQARLLFNYLGGKDTIFTNEAGEFEAAFDKLTNIEVRVYVKGYFFVAKVVELQNKATQTVNFSLERVIVGGKMLFHDLYFKGGSAIFLPSSEVALEGILMFLQMDDSLKMEIGGHINKPNADSVDTTSASFRLSEQRAKAVYDYLISKGIAPERLTYKGYGNWEMINPQAATELEQQLNRRVELKVIE